MSETLPAPANLGERFGEVHRKIAARARRCDRSPDEITLVAVTKTHSAPTVTEAIAAGMTDFGENRVQEADAKIVTVGRNAARWHLIGHLQSNKARRAAALFDVIHSLDSVALAHKLDEICAQEGREELPVLIQVDLGKEATKTGVDEKELSLVVEAARASEHLRLMGLMMIPPYFEEAERSRPFFRKLRELRDELGAGAFGGRQGELSMGMSHDYEIAIEEGATIVRVGTAIFGERKAGL